MWIVQDIARMKNPIIVITRNIVVAQHFNIDWTYLVEKLGEIVEIWVEFGMSILLCIHILHQMIK